MQRCVFAALCQKGDAVNMVDGVRGMHADEACLHRAKIALTKVAAVQILIDE